MSRFHYPCPSCSAQLTARRRAAPGRSLRCPRCATRFPAPAAATERQETAALPPTPPAGAPRAAALVLAGVAVVVLLAAGLILYCLTQGKPQATVATIEPAPRRILRGLPLAKVAASPTPVSAEPKAPATTSPAAAYERVPPPAAKKEPAVTARPAAPPVVEKEWGQDLQAGAIVQDFGRVAGVSGRKGTPVVVFEEGHNSRAEQIEIARMLLRLYRQGVRHLAVEGYVQGTSADVAWFHKDPKTLPQRRRLAVQLLEDGEVGCAEFLALALPDVTLHPIERAEEHNVELPEQPEVALQTYLDAILQQSPEDLWVMGTVRALKATKGVPASEDSLALMKGLENRAAAVAAELDPAVRRDMLQIRRFMEVRHKASDTMIAATLPLVKQFPRAPIALHIGAAHTKRVTQLLAAARQPYLVISPQTLIGGDLTGDLSPAMMRRKDHKLSVDDDNGPGALLDGRRQQKGAGLRGRKRPEPVIGEPWFRAKVDLYSLTAAAARAADGLGKPPFGIAETDPGRPRVALVPGTIQKLRHELIFAVDVSKRRLWVRTTRIPRSPQRATALDGSSLESLEELLNRALRRVRSGQSLPALATEEFRATGSRRAIVVREAGPQTVQVDCDTLAMVAATRQGIVQAIATE